MRQALRTVLVAVTLLASACDEPSESAAPQLRIEPYASVVSPPSTSDEVVLLEGGAACVIETYWYRVVCADPGGESFTFGAEGEGPGEFTRPTDILRGPAGTIGVVDGRLNRLSVFSRSGRFMAASPGLPTFLTHAGRSIAGGTMAAGYLELDPGAGPSFVQAEIDTATGIVAWERTFPDQADVVDCSTPSFGPDRPRLASGHPDGGGGLLFVTCLGEFLVWYADRDAGGVIPERRVNWFALTSVTAPLQSDVVGPAQSGRLFRTR